jgi:diaminopimelate decarboxylase
VKVDSVSLGEIERALAAGYDPKTHPEDIVFTADVIDEATLARVSELRIPVNAGSVDMLEQLGQVSPVTRSGCALTPASVTATARKPIPAAKTASTASGTATCLPRWK